MEEVREGVSDEGKSDKGPLNDFKGGRGGDVEGRDEENRSRF